LLGLDQMNYKAKVGTAYILALLILFAVGVISYRDSRLESATQKWVVHSHDVLETIQDVTGRLDVAEGARMGFVLSGNRAFEKSFADSAGRALRAVGTLRDLTADNPRQQRRVDELQSILQQYFRPGAVQVENGTSVASNPARERDSVEQDHATSRRIHEVVSEIKSDEIVLLADRTRAARASSTLVQWTTPFGYALSFLFIVAAFVILRGEMIRRESVQQELMNAQAQLEKRVEERTRDLAEANQQLRRTQDRMAMAQSIARIGTYDLDIETGRSTWTSEMEVLYGLPPGGFDGQIDTWRALVHPDDLETTNRHYQQVVAERNPLELEFRIVRPDGQIRWLAARGRLFRDSAGKLTRLIGVNVDITDRKLRETQIESLNEILERRVDERTAELVRANQELEAFSYSVSHDLRAPLRHIDGFARILREEHAPELSDDGLRYLDRILSAVTHMGHLVDDLLTLARIGRKEMDRQRVNLDELVRQALAELAVEEQAREIEWRIETLPEVEGDRGLLKLVVFNLLSNAVKFTRTRRPAVIEVGNSGTPDAPIFYVRDNGVGFDPKYADKLFGVFQRLHRQEDFEGTGIGLATVQRIVRRHGGEIHAEAAPDRGATFLFTLKTLPHRNAPIGATETNIGRSWKQ
jgi:PAS domain S-box-containing protein